MTSKLGPFTDSASHDEALSLDATAAMGQWRDQFVESDPDLVYLLGNSLGRLPAAAVDLVGHVVDVEWGDRLIRSWNEGWWDRHVELGDSVASIIGAEPGEVAISDSTSVNLHKLALAAVRARPGRTKIVTDDLNFPSDYYVLDSVAELVGGRVEMVTSDGIHGPVDELIAAIDEDTALVSLSHTVFKSGYTYDLGALTSEAHAAGALVLWDMSHSAGVIADGVGRAGVDLAVGCTYKYLNGGPGSPAFVYVRSDLQSMLHNPVRGWWGHDDPFAFESAYRPVDGIRAFHAGTMPILSLSAARPGIEMIADVGVGRLRDVSVSLLAFAERLFDDELADLGFRWNTPRDPARRGSHVSLAHNNAWQIAQALEGEAKVLLDFRAPDNIRLGFAPLYTRHVDVHTSMMRIRHVVESEVWRKYPATIAGVT
ncbi:MAG: aminotransferase class V-fold PLP-dependent enzyme [Actinomycetia bacterium]|nr:aminotransferase class V-fold PLP-dependent enzyme [Actinomycetes bacterium]